MTNDLNRLHISRRDDVSDHYSQSSQINLKKKREATENTYLLSLKNERAVNILFLGDRARKRIEARIKSNDMRVMIDKCTKYEKQDIQLSGKHGRSK